MTRKTAFGAIVGLLLFATAGAQPSAAAGLTIGYGDWAGVGRLAGRPAARTAFSAISRPTLPSCNQMEASDCCSRKALAIYS